VVAALTALCALPAAASASYRRNGPYLDLGSKAPLMSADRLRLRDGVPEVRYGSIWYRNPTTIAQYGLQSHAYYETSPRRSMRRAMLRAAGWLVRHQGRDGAWRYRFAFSVSGMYETLPAGWISAMAQGQAISLLTRSWRLTHRARYLEAARRALAPLRRPVSKGGVFRRLDGGWWYEEYPTKQPSYTLNGFMFTLLGLYDLAPWSKTAKRLYVEGRRTLIHALPLYDRASGPSVYHLGYRYGYPVHISAKYNAIHVVELQALNWIGPSRTLRHYRDRWARAE
jgi:heparosan-N-sulfate-glucuronate 5-epimerase